MNDVFSSDAFGIVALTNAINALPYQPMRIGQLGIFQEQGVPTTSVALEFDGKTLRLIPTKARGAPATANTRDGRTVRSFAVPHIPLEDVVLPEDYQNVRRFGSNEQLEGVGEVIARRLSSMRSKLETTIEYHRLGAVQGIIKDADGSTTIHNLFTDFGVSQDTVGFELATSTTKVRKKCLAVLRLIETALGGIGYTTVRAVCGKDFFEALISHADVETAYQRYQDGSQLRNDPRYSGFEFAGIFFEEYRGSIAGSGGSAVNFVDVDNAHFFPTGLPDLFMNYWAPADFVETANTVGLPFYAKQEMRKMGRGVDLHAQTNPLCICTRPKSLVKGTRV